MSGNDSHRSFLQDLKIAHDVYTIEVVDEDSKKITLHLAGPAGTPYVGGVYEVDIKFPATYPDGLPEIVFNVPIWNAAVEPSTGRVSFNNETNLNVGQTLNYVDDLLKVLDFEDDSEFAKTARFWSAEFAGAMGYPEYNILVAKVRKVEEMGFPTKDAIIALSECEWKVEEAAVQLIDQASTEC
ncbi:CRE-UBC-22 protein [Caenorhabditis remanei]|uniref:CRE-UBC-22 protein n=1 Tax=Caenorhabditis remanei TaxID=31234 RepID=E3NDY6_CAERE|nr:CRE-UBC-22 protein [Caenorhabditis remanei]